MDLVSGFGGFFFIFIIFFLGSGAGALIAEVVRKVIGKRRAKSLFITVTSGVVAGGLLANVNTLIIFLLSGNIMVLTSLLWPGIFIFLAATTTYMRLSGIQIGR